ncbi:hypothetical protein C8Q75DRAFT_339305 [Abortiporus biennis]|nr:hypothetical protein C8Q75DRAFT_339305 [Abortiporus biennis]
MAAVAQQTASETLRPSSAPPTPSSQGSVFSRIKRTVSHRGYFSHKSSPSSSPPLTPSVNVTSPDEHKDWLARAKTIRKLRLGRTPFEVFVDTVSKKRKRDDDPHFPPSDWNTENTTTEEQNDYPAIDKSLPALPEESATEATGTSVSDGPDESATPPEPVTLAQRIQAMIYSIPPVFSSTPATSSAESAVPAMISDPKMISFLSSPSVMNGSSNEGGAQSVWYILDRLKAILPGQSTSVAEGSSTSQTGQNTEDTTDVRIIEDDSSSVMLYGPIIPETDSVVELADSEIISEAGGETSVPGSPGTEPQQHERKVWLPSTTKISLQVMWWGYRIYLPPPVLDILDNKRIEGAKRAAIITTALKWLMEHIPMMIIPSQFRTVVTLLKSLIPYLGYVGAFVAWSWGAIKKFDKGHGVILSATWLLPIALIPGTWEEYHFPELKMNNGTETQSPDVGTPPAESSGGTTPTTHQQ